MPIATDSTHPSVGAVRKARKLQRELAKAYPDARCELDYTDAFTLLIATLLSAQTTDVRVNLVTPALFAEFPTPYEMAQADPEAVAAHIKSLGMAPTKSRNIVALAQQLVATHGGEVPSDLAGLTALPGVGRKTAHVVLGEVFGQPFLTVDTHVTRLAARFGWSHASNPRAIEDEVAALFQGQNLTMLSHQVIIHGRRCCTARRPSCHICPVSQLCPSVQTGQTSTL